LKGNDERRLKRSIEGRPKLSVETSIEIMWGRFNLMVKVSGTPVRDLIEPSP
jgi:hypothetical protein